MAGTADPAVLYEVSEHIAQITLNRPENRNSMTEDVLEGLAAAVAQVRADDDLRCVIVTGKGKSFCAGADFKSQLQRDGDGGGRTLLPNERSFAMYSPFLSMLDIEIPLIGALNGHAASPHQRQNPTIRPFSPRRSIMSRTMTARNVALMRQPTAQWSRCQRRLAATRYAEYLEAAPLAPRT